MYHAAGRCLFAPGMLMPDSNRGEGGGVDGKEKRLRNVKNENWCKWGSGERHSGGSVVGLSGWRALIPLSWVYHGRYPCPLQLSCSLSAECDD
jgi:hypothetical protein